LQAERIEAHAALLLEKATASAEAGDSAETLRHFDQLLFYKPDHKHGHEMKAQVRN
jgi:hypothetical protein